MLICFLKNNHRGSQGFFTEAQETLIYRCEKPPLIQW